MTAEKLIERATTLGIGTPSALSSAIGVNTSTASRWLSGQSPIPEWLMRFLDVLETARTESSKAQFWHDKHFQLESKLRIFKDLLQNIA